MPLQLNMNRWKGKVAVITGAASGIGRAVYRTLAKHGVLVVGLDKNSAKLRETIDDIEGVEKSKLYARRVDVTNEDEIVRAFEWINDELGGVDILVNCAGIAVHALITESTGDDLRNMLGVNVIAVAIATREAVASMKSRGVTGHIINLNSVHGHKFANPILIPACMYTPGKTAVTAMTEIVRKELNALNPKIKITSISPGVTKTGLPGAGGFPNHEQIYVDFPYLEPEDIADAIVRVLETPPNVQITELTIRPMNETL